MESGTLAAQRDVVDEVVKSVLSNRLKGFVLRDACVVVEIPARTLSEGQPPGSDPFWENVQKGSPRPFRPFRCSVAGVLAERHEAVVSSIRGSQSALAAQNGCETAATAAVPRTRPWHCSHSPVHAPQ